MDRLAWVALSKVTEDSAVRRRLTNELANVNTIGFKRSYETAVKTLKSKGPGFDDRFQVYVFPEDLVTLEAGPMMATGRNLDIAMENSTVMSVEAPNGDQAFTRRGDLKVDAGGLLVNGSGHPVLGQNGTINIPVGLELNIAPDGTIYSTDPTDPNAEAVEVDRIMLRDASETQLIRREDALLKPIDDDAGPFGDIVDGDIPPSIKPGTLEGANSSAIESMLQIIDHSRQFEAQIRIIKEAKTMDESAATMLRATK